MSSDSTCKAGDLDSVVPGTDTSPSPVFIEGLCLEGLSGQGLACDCPLNQAFLGSRTFAERDGLAENSLLLPR